MGTRRILVLIAAISLIVAACSSPGTQDEKADRQQQTIDQMVEQLSIQATAIGQLKENLTGIGARVDTLDLPRQPSNDIAQMKRDLEIVNTNAQDAYGIAQDALTTAEDALDRTDEITSCLNTYMDVIGRWSSNVNSYFEWFYC